MQFIKLVLTPQAHDLKFAQQVLFCVLHHTNLFNVPNSNTSKYWSKIAFLFFSFFIKIYLQHIIFIFLFFFYFTSFSLVIIVLKSWFKSYFGVWIFMFIHFERSVNLYFVVKKDLNSFSLFFCKIFNWNLSQRKFCSFVW